jgi:hypothetical protein
MMMMNSVVAFCALAASATAFAPAFSRRSSAAPAFNLAAATDSFTAAEKERIIDNVFDCHGFFPDMRDESELPSEVVAMREQPKSAGELAAIKAKYASMSESDAAFTMLVDLGLMEDYDKLGEYSDDFADDSM